MTGHVYLDDTKGPARSATVYLKPVAMLQADDAPHQNSRYGTDLVTATVETQFDGTYSFTHVAPGAYFVIADCPGYISPFLALSIAQGRFQQGESSARLDPQQKKRLDRILDSLPRVDVQTGMPASADVVLERGAAINGNARYDDGSPAAHLQVQSLVRAFRNGKETWEVATTFMRPPDLTDDRGNYRISSLPAGEYAVEVLLTFSDNKGFISSSASSAYSSNAHSATLPIYSGSTPRAKEAAVFALQPREERTGEDLVIPISKLHTVRGNVVSARDGHVVNSGQVDLLHGDDHSFVASQSLTEDDPSFTFSFIFEGDYILDSPVAADMEYEPVPGLQGDLGPPQFKAHLRHQYGSTSTRLHVDGDIQGVTIGVPEPTPTEIRMYQDALRQSEPRSDSTHPQ